MDRNDPKNYSTEDLIKMRDNGRRTLRAYEAGDLADMGVHARYGGGDSVLDRNFERTERVRSALKRVTDELKERGVT